MALSNEAHLVTTIVFCAALIGAAVMLRDATVTSAVAAAQQLEVLELRTEPTQEPAYSTWTLCSVLPTATDVLLMVFALLVFITLILTARKKAGARWQTAAEIGMVCVLIAFIAQYAACNIFMPLQYVTYVLFILVIVVVRIIAYEREKVPKKALQQKIKKKAPGNAKLPRLPSAPAPIVMQFAPQTPASFSKKKTPKVSKPAAPPVRPTGVHADFEDVFATIQQSEHTLKRLDKALRRIKKA